MDEGARGPSRNRRRALGSTLRAVVSVGLLVAVAWQMDLASVWETARMANARLVLLAGGLAVGGRLFAALRWYLLVHQKNPEARMGRIVRLVFISSLLGMFLPGLIGVEVIRIYGLSRSTSDPALSLASVLVERVLAMGTLIVLVLVGLLFAPPGLPASLSDAAWIGLLVLVVGSVAILHPAARNLGDRLLRMVRLGALTERVHKVYAALDTYKSQHAIMAWSVAAALGAVAFRIIPTVVLSGALGLGIPLVHFVVFLPLIHFIAQVPISLGGLGVRETAFVTLFGLVGVPAEGAFTLSLVVYFVTVFSVLPGAWFYARGGLAGDSPRRTS